MPKDASIQRVLIIGSGPIVIGQACEFDYSGTQACRTLLAENIQVVLLNSNPATIMTDPQMADRTYVEPIVPGVVEEILRLEAERGTPVDCILPTLGGQTALNCAMQVAESGALQRHRVRLIGADRDVIRRAEDREIFKQTIQKVGIDVPCSGTASTFAEALQVLERVGLPACIRPAFTLGGTGGSIASSSEEFRHAVREGLSQSPISQVLIEEDLTGWKEFELEMMRDHRDNVVVVCCIENFDPMGVHTGDSITVAPSQTLTDKEYHRMRDAAIAIMRAVGVTTGGSNIQFAVNPFDGRLLTIEMNPRVSRSSALASKATGFPIAKIATKLAIGYSLDEIQNDITRETPACFEPAIDYCVVKIPRFTFEKFPDADERLTTSMKSVGEAMAIGRTFKEAFQKCIRSMEIKRPGLGVHPGDAWLHAHQSSIAAMIPACEPEFEADTSLTAPDGTVGGSTLAEPPADIREASSAKWPIPDGVLREKIGTPCQGRIYYIRYALKLGWTVDALHELSGIDRWFLNQIRELVDFEGQLFSTKLPSDLTGVLPPELVETYHQARSYGYSDVQLRTAWSLDRSHFCILKERLDRTDFKLVDTCAAEFDAVTPYYYATHERATAIETSTGILCPASGELQVSDREKVIILGGGPNRIGQGIEFDYCCVHAAMAAGELGYETVMVNSNPETVSTDYDVSNLLFFEPLTHEAVFRICRHLNSRPFLQHDGSSKTGKVRGVIVQYGGQTPLNLAQGLFDEGVPILGTTTASIHLSEDRERFKQVLRDLGLRQPPNGIAFSPREAIQIARELGFPVLVRPSYVLGGRGMQICNNMEDLDRFMQHAMHATDRESTIDREHPILVDKFLLDAVEVDVDAISDYGYVSPQSSDAQGHEPPRTETGRCDICGIMEHIEEAGIHSGDSCCVLPPYSLSPALVDEIKYQTKLLAKHMRVCGLMNVQYAIQGRVVYVLEVNPRASRTIPFVSKATGVPWAKIATKVMLGMSLDQALHDLGIQDVQLPRHVSVKAPVFPFRRFPGVDAVLGPEMRSTGEVMGIDDLYPMAFAKAMHGAGIQLPTSGRVLISVNDPDKPRIIGVARELHELGFEIVSTLKTHEALEQAGVPSRIVSKLAGDDFPFLLDLILQRELVLLINTPIHTGSASDEGRWRAACIQMGIPLITTIAGARAAVGAIRAMSEHKLSVRALQDYISDSLPRRPTVPHRSM